jgi:hypothetical protein
VKIDPGDHWSWLIGSIVGTMAWLAVALLLGWLLR